VCQEATKKTEKHTAHSEKINLLSDDITKNVAAERLLLLLPLLTLSLSHSFLGACVCVYARCTLTRTSCCIDYELGKTKNLITIGKVR